MKFGSSRPALQVFHRVNFGNKKNGSVHNDYLLTVVKLQNLGSRECAVACPVAACVVLGYILTSSMVPMRIINAIVIFHTDHDSRPRTKTFYFPSHIQWLCTPL